MTELILLFYSFFRLGLFSYGGGYAMISLIQRETLSHGWLTAAQFADIVAIAEMTPGPIAINSATYVGYKVAGITGSAFATFALVLPSFVLILLASKYLIRWQKHPLNQMVFYGLRPVIIGLIASAGFVIAQTSIIRPFDQSFGSWVNTLLSTPGDVIHGLSVLIFGAVFVLEWRAKMNPILLIALAGLASGLLMPFFP